MVHVEADLIDRFKKKFGEIPLRNRQTPSAVTQNQYAVADQQVLYCGKGSKYHWAIRPMRSSPFFRLG
ncbi:MAG: hypothetical protein EON87_15500 [Brevundimonas sp.]|nr:MAG: hypothetical protein EON87_15500 [Brevundimonas sp.]